MRLWCPERNPRCHADPVRLRPGQALGGNDKEGGSSKDPCKAECRWPKTSADTIAPLGVKAIDGVAGFG